MEGMERLYGTILFLAILLGALTLGIMYSENPGPHYWADMNKGWTWENEYVRMEHADIVVNESGVYLHVSFTVKKTVWLDKLYYNTPMWRAATKQFAHGYLAEQEIRAFESDSDVGSIELSAWYEPGTYNVTVKLCDGPLLLGSVGTLPNGTYYVAFKAPTKPDGSPAPRYYYYVLEDVEPADKLISASVTVELDIPLQPGIRLVYLEPADYDGFVRVDSELGKVRGRVTSYHNVILRVAEDAGDPAEAAARIAELTRELLENGLNITEEMVFYDAWLQAGRPDAKPTKPALLVVRVGDCLPGGPCTLQPMILHGLMRKILAGEHPAAITVTAYEARIIGEARIGGAPAYIVQYAKRTAKTTTLNGPVEETAGKPTLTLLLGPDPATHRDTCPLTWTRVALVAKPAPHAEPTIASIPTRPALPEPLRDPLNP